MVSPVIQCYQDLRCVLRSMPIESDDESHVSVLRVKVDCMKGFCSEQREVSMEITVLKRVLRESS